MSMTVKVDLSVARRKLVNNTKARYTLANQMHQDMNDYVPMLSSDLRNQSTISLDGKTITWHAPYAKVQYKGYRMSKGKRVTFRKYSTSGTGPKWDVKAKSVHMDKWIKVAAAAMEVR